MPGRQDVARVIAGRGPIRGDDDAFTGSQTVVLDDVGRAAMIEGRVDLTGLGNLDGGGGGHAGGGHDLFGECLRALDPGGGRGRSEHGETVVPQQIRRPRHQRDFGPDHHQVGLQHDGQFEYGTRLGDVHRVGGGQRRRSCVARSDMQIARRRVAAQGPQDGVFTSSGPDDEDAHGIKGYRRPALLRALVRCLRAELDSATVVFATSSTPNEQPTRLPRSPIGVPATNSANLHRPDRCSVPQLVARSPDGSQ